MLYVVTNMDIVSMKPLVRKCYMILIVCGPNMIIGIFIIMQHSK